VNPIVPSALESAENELNDMLGWRKTLPTLKHVYSWRCFWYVCFLILYIHFSLKLWCLCKVNPYKSIVMCENVVDARMLLLILRHWILILIALFLLRTILFESKKRSKPHIAFPDVLVVISELKHETMLQGCDCRGQLAWDYDHTNIIACSTTTDGRLLKWIHCRSRPDVVVLWEE
jgi:hypothetical protein